MPPGSSEEKPRGICRLFRGGNCRYGANCKFRHDASSSQATSVAQNEAGNTQGATAPGTSSTSTTSPAHGNVGNGGNLVKIVKRADKPCRAWKAGNCKWGDKCHFQHEIKISQGNFNPDSTRPRPQQSFPTMNTASSPMAGAPSISAGNNERQNNRKGKNTRSLPSQVILATQANSEEETLRRVREQVEVARLAREQGEAARRVQEEAIRKVQEEAARRAREEEEAARKAQQEVARLAQERAAAARRERQLQLAREREEARERERQAQRRKQEEEWAKEAVMTIQQVVLNSFVKFEAGLNIQHVICGFEASQILVKNIPMYAKRSEIIALFTQQGIDEEDLVILRIENVDGCQQATVLGKAADVETVAVGLDGIEFHEQHLEFVVCERSSEGRTMGSSNRNSYHLSISWRPSFLNMLAHYPHLDIWGITQKARELDHKLLNGQRAKAELHYDQQRHVYDMHGDHYHHIPGQHCIKISRISNGTSVEMVRTFAGSQRVEIHQDPSSYTSNDVFSALDRHIRALLGSTLRTLTLENIIRPNSVSAKAIFSSWEGAKSARDSLDGKILQLNFPALRLFLSDPYRFVITIDEKQYNAQKSQWTEICDGKGKDVTVQTKIVDKAGGRKAIITLFGRDKKVVGALKVRIENMATGQKLDATYWHPTFKFGKGQNFINGLYETTGAYARCDWKHNRVAVFGRPEAVENAKSHIKNEVERITSEEWTIPLQRRALGFFIRKGLAQMKGLLGEENVTLDVASAKIILHGADLEEARHHLRQLMDAFMQHASESTVASDDALCPICYDTVSQPIETGCEHIYCSPCLRHYILSTLDNHNFPLKCMGNDATCNKPLSIPLIKKFLPPQRFEHLLAAAFTSYLDKNPETFKYCNTPDCSQVYRTTAEPQELQCPSCFSEICTACNEEGHAGMTCVEKRQHKDPGEQERLLEAWATQNNVKKCPSCRTWVEKTEGCHHMTCKCGVHFCWICSGVFDAGRIYDHMTQAHGDWYNDPERDRRRAAYGVQPREQVPNIIQIAGGQAAVAEQAAELRRLELLRENHAARPVPPAPIPAAPARPAVQPLPANLNPFRNQYEEQMRRLRMQREAVQEAARQERAQEEQVRNWERMVREAREEREREGARRATEAMRNMEREAMRRRELEARRRQAEENKGWCIIM